MTTISSFHREQLEALLRNAFDAQGLRRFASHGPDGDAFRAALPVPASLDELAHAYVEALSSRGAIDLAFFARWATARPALHLDIAALTHAILGLALSAQSSTLWIDVEHEGTGHRWSVEAAYEQPLRTLLVPLRHQLIATVEAGGWPEVVPTPNHATRLHFFRDADDEQSLDRSLPLGSLVRDGERRLPLYLGLGFGIIRD